MAHQQQKRLPVNLDRFRLRAIRLPVLLRFTTVVDDRLMDTFR